MTSTTLTYALTGSPASPATSSTSLSIRTSPLGWETAYTGTTKRAYRSTNVLTRALGSYTNNQFSPYMKRYFKGPSGEFLDAYVYANFDLGAMPANLKVGRNAVLWALPPKAT